ncbi:MAG: hypothetical protein Ta2A_09320 [Treponemataceae bacterium]|nr:MAG: hypothetical protein Ta2A_09320 [Treponemataceae bacterium]
MKKLICLFGLMFAFVAVSAQPTKQDVKNFFYENNSLEKYLKNATIIETAAKSTQKDGTIVEQWIYTSNDKIFEPLLKLENSGYFALGTTTGWKALTTLSATYIFSITKYTNPDPKVTISLPLDLRLFDKTVTSDRNPFCKGIDFKTKETAASTQTTKTLEPKPIILSELNVKTRKSSGWELVDYYWAVVNGWNTAPKGVTQKEGAFLTKQQAEDYLKAKSAAGYFIYEEVIGVDKKSRPVVDIIYIPREFSDGAFMLQTCVFYKAGDWNNTNYTWFVIKK